MRLTRLPAAVAVAVAVAVAAATLTAGPAGATPPGSNGRLAFLLDANDGSYIYTVEPDGSDAKRVFPGDDKGDTAASWDIEWSPDGTKLAFTRNVDGNQDVYAMDAGGTDVVRLTKHAAAESSPVWSPNGKRLAFVSDRSGRSSIYLMTAEGRYIRRVTKRGINAADLDWDPRGRRIAFAGDKGRAGRSLRSDGIFTVRPNGSRLKQLTSDGGRAPSWAPRGTRLAYSSPEYHEWGDDRILFVRRNGTKRHVIDVPPGCEDEECYLNEPVWSPDGRELAFLLYDRGFYASYVAVVDLHTGELRTLFSEDPGVLLQVSWQSL